MKNQNDEEWEIKIGGNFLKIWEAGKSESPRYLNYECGSVCDIDLPPALTIAESIKLALPRAYKIVAAPAMLWTLEKILPIIECEAEQRDEARMDPREVGTDEYWLEMREAVAAVGAVIHLARYGTLPELPAEDYPETETDCPENVCPHGVAQSNYDNDDYDYAADDMNFDADRERRMK